MTSIPVGPAPSEQYPSPGAARVLSVVHDTTYTYAAPVHRSGQLFRLRPVDDRRQEVLEHRLELSVGGERREYEDVFGNHALRFRPAEIYTELKIRSRSVVRVRGAAEPDRVDFSEPVTHPVVWMPWQRMMMLPYLIPAELPESELKELSTYAMGFVQRTGGDLVQALRELNETMHQEFAYLPGTTGVETTPYETYIHRRGVCQDFAWLFICLAQLLNVPARYRVGYIYTGVDYEGSVRSDASHAWAEVYLPNIGWYGFDPTNGRRTGLELQGARHAIVQAIGSIYQTRRVLLGNTSSGPDPSAHDQGQGQEPQDGGSVGRAVAVSSGMMHQGFKGSRVQVFVGSEPEDR
jgi:transglutaminase-like putative cysteine protease